MFWLRQVVEEAYAVVDFEGPLLDVPADPYSLGLCILRIWSRFFLANTQWNFIGILGASLRTYGEHLERSRNLANPDGLST
jgi:hypothetical protein